MWLASYLYASAVDLRNLDSDSRTTNLLPAGHCRRGGRAFQFVSASYGPVDPVLRIARELGLEPVMWNAIGYDWLDTTPQRIEQNVAKSIRGGDVIVLHDETPASGDGSVQDGGCNGSPNCKV